MTRTPPEFDGIPITEGTLIPTDRTLPPVPLKHTDIQASIIGPLSSVRVTQRFHNTHSRPVEALYVFPLPEDAAVTDLTLHIGERTVKGDVRERTQAQREYATARDAGQGAALLEQERPNMFTVSVANIQPDEEVQVAIAFHHRVAYDDSEFSFVLPTVVLPRYIPANPEATPDAPRLQTPLLPEETRDGHTLSIRIELDAGKLTSLSSPSHEIATEQARMTTVVTLREAESIPNKDFVLRYRVSENQFEAAAYTYRPPDQPGTLLLMLAPPTTFLPDDVFPREVLFVLDRSGSMGGDSIVQAHNALRSCLRALNPGDTFNIFPFDNRVEQFAPDALPFTQESLDRADAYMSQIQARGGTEILQALEHALKQKRDAERVRMIVFLTDGAVGNEDQVLRKLRRSLNEARVYAFGIGSAVNRFLLDKLAEVGRGTVEYLLPGQSIEEAVQRFQNRAAFPVLTDVQVAWGEAQISDPYPDPLPDLYAGQPLTMLARFHNRQSRTIQVRLSGQTRQGAYEQTMELALPEATPDRSEHWAALPRVWARARIDALMSQQRDEPKQTSKVRDEILGLALEHRLLSPYTAFVAVEERDPEHANREEAEQVVVPVHLPQGTHREAFEPSSARGRKRGGALLSAAPPPFLGKGMMFQARMPASGGARESADADLFEADTVDFLPSFAAFDEAEAETEAEIAPMSLAELGLTESELAAMAPSPADHATGSAPAGPTMTRRERSELALRSLARTQRVNGSWGDSAFATALALLAFVRGGHTDRAGSYRPQLTRTVAWLMEQANGPSVDAVVALALNRLASSTGDSRHDEARATACRHGVNHDELDAVCLALAENTRPPALPVLPDEPNQRWALALVLLALLHQPVPDEARSWLEQHQQQGGNHDGAVMVPGGDAELVSAMTAALANISYW